MPLIEMADCVYAESNNRITKTNIAIGVEVGMVAYIIESEVPDEYVETGRYVITARDPGDDDWIECDGIDSDDDTDVDVVIGGAFPDLQDALDETDASDHSVTIYVQNNGIVEAAIDVDAGGGNNTKNTFKRILGFNTSPGDMNYGGTYYESPIDILKNGSISSSKAVLLDGDSIGGYSILNIDQDNIIFENFHLTNTDGENAILFTGTPQNIVFRNCRFSDVFSVFNSEADYTLVDSCYTHNDLTSTAYVCKGKNIGLLNCVTNSDDCIFTVFNGSAGMVDGCLVVGVTYGVFVANPGAEVSVMNNTFYGASTYGVAVGISEGAVVRNNIFALDPGAVGLNTATAGSYIYNDYNCFIETDGTPLTVGFHNTGYQAPVIGPHSITVDPDFVDAANGDFRARNPLLLRGGRPGPDGRASVIGAIGQEYQFAERARVMNAGRAGIIK